MAVDSGRPLGTRVDSRSAQRLRMTVACAAVALVIECGPFAAPGPDHAADCSRLESRLQQLTRSSDPGAFARSQKLDLGADGVVVVVDLTPGASIPSSYHAVILARYLESVQARVPVGELCPLARETGVLSVSAPALEPK